MTAVKGAIVALYCGASVVFEDVPFQICLLPSNVKRWKNLKRFRRMSVKPHLLQERFTTNLVQQPGQPAAGQDEIGVVAVTCSDFSSNFGFLSVFWLLRLFSPCIRNVGFLDFGIPKGKSRKKRPEKKLTLLRKRILASSIFS